MPPAAATTTTPIQIFFQTFIRDSLLCISGASLSSDCPCSVNTHSHDRKFPANLNCIKFRRFGNSPQNLRFGAGLVRRLDGRAPRLVLIVVDSERYWKGCLGPCTAKRRGEASWRKT